jgi:hypothetical protein
LGLFTYNINDPHDRPEDIRAAAIVHPDVQQSHVRAEQIRKAEWDARRISTAGSSLAGNPDFTWLAKIPRRVADLWDLRYPGWDADESMLNELLRKHPECKISEEI